MEATKALEDMRALAARYNAGPQELTAEECDTILQDMVEHFEALDGWMKIGGHSPWKSKWGRS